jgi:hypothetical protein
MKGSCFCDAIKLDHKFQIEKLDNMNKLTAQFVFSAGKGENAS